MENTHEALVSKDVFDRVQELIETRRRKQKDGTTQIFSGLVKCADCGWSLAFGMNNQNKKPMVTTIAATMARVPDTAPCTISAMISFIPTSWHGFNIGLTRHRWTRDACCKSC